MSKKHKFYTNWKEFWDFYISSVKESIGENQFKVLSGGGNFKEISRRLPVITKKERVEVINPLIREHGYITSDISLKYDPNATTFYSYFDKDRPRGKQIVIGYPTFTKYMVHYKPCIEAAFRHELGHIIRKHIFQNLSQERRKNANTCMDITINNNLDRQNLRDVYKCLYFKDEDEELLVPEEQFPKIGLPEAAIRNVPSWETIAWWYNKANQRVKSSSQQPKQPPQDKFKIGDVVIIDTKTSAFDGQPGRIIDIQDDEYIVEEIPQEMLDELLENLSLQLEETQIFGSFGEDELLPLTPPGEQGGGEGEGGEGEGEGQEQETGEGEGQSQGQGNEEEKSSIDKKRDILDQLRKAGVSGENEDKKPVFDDDDDPTDWSSKFDPEAEEKNKEKHKADKEREEKEEEKDKEPSKEESEEGSELSDEEKELDREIKEANLIKDIQQSIDNFTKIREDNNDILTKQESKVLEEKIEKLKNLL